LVEDLREDGKLGQGFSSIDALEEMNIRDGTVPRPTYMNANLTKEQKEQVWCLTHEFIDCFAWEYVEMPGLGRDLVEHHLPIKPGFKPYRQPPRNFSPALYPQTKEEVDRLLKAKFIQLCQYADWVLNIVLIEKKNTGKIRICVDFRDLNRATPKDEYPMHIAESLVNSVPGNKIISFLDGNAGYNQIFMASDDVAKTAFRFPSFLVTQVGGDDFWFEKHGAYVPACHESNISQVIGHYGRGLHRRCCCQIVGFRRSYG
jgi:hypothetical protein